MIRRRARAPKAWAGRFAAPTAAAAEAFTTSLPLDRRLYPHDIDGSVALKVPVAPLTVSARLLA